MPSIARHVDMETQPSECTTNVTAPVAIRKMSYWDRVCQNQKTKPERRVLARSRYLWWNKALLKMYVDATEVSEASKDRVA